MRFLYGDSTPFPLGYNFLTTLEAFMTAATRVVQLDVEARAVATQHEVLAQSRVVDVTALETFHDELTRVVGEAAMKVVNQQALRYARALGDYGARYVDEYRQSTLAATEEGALKARAERELCTAKMQEELEAFLKVARIPVATAELSMTLDGDARESRYAATSIIEHHDGITTAFKIAPHRNAAWSAARKVSDFVQGIELRVGIEKSWLRGTVSLKQLSVDDWTIGALELTSESFAVVLRRRLTDKEALTFRLVRSESGELAGVVERPGAERETVQLAPPDLAQLERLWRGLSAATEDVLLEKELLLDVALDGEAVFENGLALSLVSRLVAMFAPTVREIAKRSPNAVELTLKVEAEEGRRDELYLRKDALVRTLQPLSASSRQVFAPLGLDSWVPSLTAAPPPVRTEEPSIELALEATESEDDLDDFLKTVPNVLPTETKV